MRRFLGFLLSVALGGAIVACAYEFHLVRTVDTVIFVKKQAPDWRDAYVDVRGWKPRDWAAHPKLVRNLTVAKRDDIIEQSASVPVPKGWFKSISSRVEEEVDEVEDDLGLETEDTTGPSLEIDDSASNGERYDRESRRR